MFRGVVTYKGKLVENLHVVMAEKIVQQHELIEKMRQQDLFVQSSLDQYVVCFSL